MLKDEALLFNKDRNFVRIKRNRIMAPDEILDKLKIIAGYFKFCRAFLTNLLFPFQVDGCINYTVLGKADRAQGNALQPHTFNDSKKLATGWYRFQGAAGDRMPDECVLRFRCGTKHPGWLNGTHPTIADGVTTRTVCFSNRTNCCSWRIMIKVKNCSSYYVYELQRPRGPRSSWPESLRYCGNAGAGKLIYCMITS